MSIIYKYMIYLFIYFKQTYKYINKYINYLQMF